MSGSRVRPTELTIEEVLEEGQRRRKGLACRPGGSPAAHEIDEFLYWIEERLEGEPAPADSELEAEGAE